MSPATAIIVWKCSKIWNFVHCITSATMMQCNRKFWSPVAKRQFIIKLTLDQLNQKTQGSSCQSRLRTTWLNVLCVSNFVRKAKSLFIMCRLVVAGAAGESNAIIDSLFEPENTWSILLLLLLLWFVAWRRRRRSKMSTKQKMNAGERYTVCAVVWEYVVSVRFNSFRYVSCECININGWCWRYGKT